MGTLIHAMEQPFATRVPSVAIKGCYTHTR
jgi:hypothetical protein